MYLSQGIEFEKEFYKLEDMRLLDPNNQLHRLILHKVYRKEINVALKKFVAGWNMHKLRTENYKTPLQVWVGGYLGNINSNHTAVRELLQGPTNLRDRIQDIFDNQYGLNTTALHLDVNTTEDVSSNLTDDQNVHIENLLNTDMPSRERYTRCLEYLSTYT